MSFQGDNPNEYSSFVFKTETTPAHSSGVIIFNDTSGFLVSDGSQWLRLDRDEVSELSGAIALFGTSGSSMSFLGTLGQFTEAANTYKDEIDKFDTSYPEGQNSGDLMKRSSTFWETESDTLANDVYNISGFPEVDVLNIASGQHLKYKASGALYTGGVDLKSNLSGVYLLGDGAASGTDEIGTFNLTSVNTHGSRSGIDGICPEFNGASSNNRIYRSWSSAFGYNAGGSAYAFSLWFNKDSQINADEEGTIFTLSDANQSRISFALSYDESDENVTWEMYNFFGQATTVTSAVNSAPSDQWHHAFCIVRTGTLETELWLNGTLIAKPSYPFGSKTPNTSEVVTVGATAAGTGGRRFGGKIDNLHFWALRNMSGVHVSGMYNNGIGLTYNASIDDFVESFSGGPSFRNVDEGPYDDVALIENITDVSGSPSSGQLLGYNGTVWTPTDPEPDIYTTSLLLDETVFAQTSYDIDDFVVTPTGESIYKIILQEWTASTGPTVDITLLSEDSDTSAVTEITDNIYSWSKSTRRADQSTDGNVASLNTSSWNMGKKAGAVRSYANFNLFFSTKANSNNNRYGGSTAGSYNMDIAINGVVDNFDSAARRMNFIGRHDYNWPGGIVSFETFKGLRVKASAGTMNFRVKVYRIG